MRTIWTKQKTLFAPRPIGMSHDMSHVLLYKSLCIQVCGGIRQSLSDREKVSTRNTSNIKIIILSIKIIKLGWLKRHLFP